MGSNTSFPICADVLLNFYAPYVQWDKRILLFKYFAGQMVMLSIE